MPTLGGAPRHPASPGRVADGHRRPTPAATRRRAQGLLHVFQATLLRHRQAVRAAATRWSNGTRPRRATRAPPPPPRVAAAPEPHRAAAGVSPGALPRLRPRLAARRRLGPGRAANRSPPGAAEHRGTPRRAGLLPALPEGALAGPAPCRRARRPRWPAVDRPDRLPQGRLSRLLLHGPQVPP